MPGAIRIVSITTGAFTAIQPSVNGYRITIGENGSASYPTSGLTIKKHLTGDELLIPLGASFTFEASNGRRVFRPEAIRGIDSETPAIETVGYVQATDTNCDIYIDEEGL